MRALRFEPPHCVQSEGSKEKALNVFKFDLLRRQTRTGDASKKLPAALWTVDASVRSWSLNPLALDCLAYLEPRHATVQLHLSRSSSDH